MRLQLTRFSSRPQPQASFAQRVFGLLLLGVLSITAPASPGAADAASGTYTGTLAVRGNYYWERSTRVLAPATALSLDTPSGIRVEGTYLLDAITSASQATGVQSDVGFTEVRNDVSAGIGYEVDLGASQLDLSAKGRFSKEPDYLSRGIGFGAALSLNQRASVLALNGYLLNDDVGMVVRMAPADDPTRLDATKRQHVGDLRALSLGLSWDQVLTATTTFTLGVDLAALEGFQANPYRIGAFQDGGGAPEHHPNKRLREAAYLWLAQYLTLTRSTLRLGYRVYRDSWEILAHTPEVRLHQEVGKHVELRLRYRYYTQNASFFFRERGNKRADKYVTADPKMSAFRDQTVGLRLRVALDFLSFTALDALHTAALDFGVEYVFNTNRYGNGLIGQGGFGWAF
jgi:hypothetical protein